MQDPAFMKDFAGAKTELRQALGLLRDVATEPDRHSVVTQAAHAPSSKRRGLLARSCVSQRYFSGY
jgi:hypothetical protein